MESRWHFSRGSACDSRLLGALLAVEPVYTTVLGLGVAENSMAMIWTPGSRIKTYKFPDPEPLEDITWVSDTDFIVCGGRTIRVYRFDADVYPVQKYETADDFYAWAVRYDQIATAVHGNSIDVSSVIWHVNLPALT